MKSTKKIAIIQSNYIPWKGYFDFINSVDEFVLYDTVQFTRRDWRNRNQIKTKNGLLWLTIPVISKGKYFQSIHDTKIEGRLWAETHWKTLTHNYSRSPYYGHYKDLFHELYEQCAQEEYLSQVNYLWLQKINTLLDINTNISWAQTLEDTLDKTEKLVRLCESRGATEYISGPAAKSYMDPNLFNEAGISLSYMDYSGYPEYPQQFPEQGFSPSVTILDLLFNTGPQAKTFMKSFLRREPQLKNEHR